MTRARYQLKVIAAEKGGELLGSDRLPLAVDFDPSDLFAYLTERHGAPTDLAVADIEEFGRMTVGWVFAAPDGDWARELIVIPEVVLPGENEAISVFVHQERLRREFTDLMASAGVAVETIEGGSR